MPYLPTPMLSENLPKIRKLKCFNLIKQKTEELKQY